MMVPGGPGLMFTIVPIMVFVIFGIVIVRMIAGAVDYGAQKSKPEQSKAVRVLSKRQHVWGKHSHTNYYATFEFENGERQEFQIPKKEIGYIVEGDFGTLVHQGTLFVGFKREIDESYYE